MKNKKNILIYILAFIICLPLVYPWTDEAGAKNTLQKNGFRVLNVGSHHYWTTDKNLVKTKFKAISSKGDTCIGFVSKDIFGKNTICINE